MRPRPRWRGCRAPGPSWSPFLRWVASSADWKLPTGDAMFGPFTNELREYGFVIQNFWNNANQHEVSDPFGTVK